MSTRLGSGMGGSFPSSAVEGRREKVCSWEKGMRRYVCGAVSRARTEKTGQAEYSRPCSVVVGSPVVVRATLHVSVVVRVAWSGRAYRAPTAAVRASDIGARAEALLRCFARSITRSHTHARATYADGHVGCFVCLDVT